MELRGTRGIEVGFVLVVIALFAGQAVGQPVLLSYVRTGSMEPTLSPGDGFVAIPSVVAGSPEQGDVVVYRAESLNGGGLTTHRVVAATDRGYITQGDANPFTDQSSGEPPVRRHQIVAVGLQIGDDLVVVPGFGTAVRSVRETTGAVTRPLGATLGGDPRAIWVGLAVAGLVVLLFGRTDDGGRTPVSDRTHGRDRASGIAVRDVVLLAGAVVVVTATASMVLPLGPTEYTIVSAESDVPGVGVIPAGETETTTYRVPGGGVVPTRYYVEPASEGVSVDSGTGVVRPGETANVSVALSAPPELGSHRRFVTERRYPLVLPLPLVDTLYRIHPLAPLAVIDGCLALPFLVTARLVGGRIRSRSRDGGGASRLWGGRAD